MPKMSVTGERGFTLLELLVVMCILLLISSALPFAMQRSLPRHRVSSSLQQAVATIHVERLRAMLTGRTEFMAIQPHGLRVAAIQLSFPASVTLAAADSAGRPISRIGLYPDGSVQGSILTFQDGAVQSSVSISALSGRTRILK